MTSPKLPIALWLDDSVAEMMPHAHFWLNEEFSEEFKIVLFGDTDGAVEFATANADNIFMFVQDSRRHSAGKIIPVWKKLRKSDGPEIGYKSYQGDFYTYVVDAYAPAAGAVFAGFSFSESESQLIRQWGRADKRIVLANKAALFRLGQNKLPSFVDIGRQQLKRWQIARRGEALSSTTRAFVPVAEELVALCGLKPAHLDKVTPRQFEEKICAIFKNHGFRAELTSRTRDGGYDIIAVSHSALPAEVALVEVKHFAPDRPVGVGVVRALYGVKTLRRASKAYLVTSSYVSADAKREFARVIPWELEVAERSKVLQWCESYLSALVQSA